MTSAAVIRACSEPHVPLVWVRTRARAWPATRASTARPVNINYSYSMHTAA